MKANLVSDVVAGLAALFLREAVAWDGTANIAHFGVALVLVVVASSFFFAEEERVGADVAAEH